MQRDSRADFISASARAFTSHAESAAFPRRDKVESRNRDVRNKVLPSPERTTPMHSPGRSTWHEATTPNGSKFRYTLGGETQLIMEETSPWQRGTLDNGRRFWQRTGTSEIRFADPNLPKGPPGTAARQDLVRTASSQSVPGQKKAASPLPNRGNQHEKLKLRSLSAKSIDDLKQHIADFFGIVQRKKLSARWNTGYNITFAKFVATESDFHTLLTNMGITICDNDDDEKIAPYCTATDGNSAMPGFRAFYGGGKKDKITFEFNPGEKEVIAKGSRTVVMNQHTVLLAFLGRVKDITAQQASRSQDAAERVAVDDSECAKVIVQYLSYSHSPY